MPPLKDGIPLHQPTAKVHKANRRPLYLVGGILALVVICFFWAFHKAGQRQSDAHAQQIATAKGDPVPALSARQSLDKEMKTKHPVNTPEPHDSALSTPPLSHRESLTSPVNREGSKAHASNELKERREAPTQPPALSREQEAELQANQEEQAAIEAPLVSRQGQVSSSLPTTNAGQDLTNTLLAAQSTAARNSGRESLDQPIQARAPDAYGQQNGQGNKSTYAGQKVPVADILVRPPLPGSESGCVIHAGWDIPAELEQAGSSDLPGHLRARVRLNVYDSKTGSKLCLPQNSILLGDYNSDLSYAQNRLQVRWRVLQLPDGTADIDLGDMTGLDAGGSAGLTGRVDNHYKRLLGFTLLTSAFAAGIELSQRRNRNASVFTNPTNTDVVGQAVGRQLGEFGRHVTERNLDRQPTVLVPPGTRFNVRVDRALIFATPYQG